MIATGVLGLALVVPTTAFATTVGTPVDGPGAATVVATPPSPVLPPSPCTEGPCRLSIIVSFGDEVIVAVEGNPGPPGVDTNPGPPTLTTPGKGR
jgi:hypothetical protein